MAYLKIEYFSNALRRGTSFEMLIPNDSRDNMYLEKPAKPMRALFLLHGYSGKAGNWVPEELAYRYKIAVIMPSEENSYYMNGLSTVHAFQTAIAGLSMGGYGALHTGLAYPDTFGKIAALSSALIVHGIAHMKPGEDNGVANYEYYRECFGDLETVEQRETNPEVQILRLKEEHRPIPEINMYCGTEDFLLEPNREMHAFLEKEQVPHFYQESPGSHDMTFWSKAIVDAVDRMFG